MQSHFIYLADCYCFLPLQERMCLIDNRCYDDMEFHEEKECLICVPQLDQKDWSMIGGYFKYLLKFRMTSKSNDYQNL